MSCYTRLYTRLLCTALYLLWEKNYAWKSRIKLNTINLIIKPNWDDLFRMPEGCTVPLQNPKLWGFDTYSYLEAVCPRRDTPWPGAEPHLPPEACYTWRWPFHISTPKAEDKRSQLETDLICIYWDVWDVSMGYRDKKQTVNNTFVTIFTNTVQKQVK